MQIEGAIADSIHTGLSGLERTVRSDTARDVAELLRDQTVALVAEANCNSQDDLSFLLAICLCNFLYIVLSFQSLVLVSWIVFSSAKWSFSGICLLLRVNDCCHYFGVITVLFVSVGNILSIRLWLKNKEKHDHNLSIL